MTEHASTRGPLPPSAAVTVAEREDRAPAYEQSRPERRAPSLAWRLLRSHHAVVGGVLALALVVCALLGPWLSPYDPISPQTASILTPPDAQHWLGTDELGRDMVARLLFGARISLTVSALAVSFAAVVGVTIGLVAGYFGGRVDTVLMRVVDGFLAFPGLVLALSMVAFLGQSLTNIVIAVGTVAAPSFARLVRSEVLVLRGQELVQAARVIGASDRRIMLRHILPNVASLIVVLASLNSAFAILSEASLAFLGLGLPPPNASWGTMLRSGYQFVGVAPWLSITPGAAIFLAVLAFNLLGDGVRDTLDPRLRR